MENAKQNYSLQVEQLLKEYITQEFMYDKPELTLDNELSLIEQGIIDSVGIFRLISFLEENFGVSFNADEILLENFENINSIKLFVLSRLNQS